MFWNRKEKTVYNGLGILELPPVPAKKEFSTMLEMLKDAEKYDSENENECRDVILNGLCDYIERFKSKSISE